MEVNKERPSWRSAIVALVRSRRVTGRFSMATRSRRSRCALVRANPVEEE